MAHVAEIRSKEPQHSWTHERRHEEKVSKAGSEVGHDFDRSQGPYSQGTLLHSASAVYNLIRLRFDLVMGSSVQYVLT